MNSTAIHSTSVTSTSKQNKNGEAAASPNFNSINS